MARLPITGSNAQYPGKAEDLLTAKYPETTHVSPIIEMVLVTRICVDIDCLNSNDCALALKVTQASKLPASISQKRPNGRKYAPALCVLTNTIFTTNEAIINPIISATTPALRDQHNSSKQGHNK